MKKGPNSRDFLVIDADPMARMRLSKDLASISTVRVSEHAGARSALTSFSRVRFDAVLLALEIEDTDPWRFLRMVRSGKFGFGDVPVFVVGSEREAGALAPLLDPASQFVANDAGISVSEAILARLEIARRSRVLIVEDEPAAAAAAERALAKYFHAELACDGETALSLWRAQPHELVLLDLMLPGMTGRDVLGAMLTERPSQPIVVLTAHDDADSHRELMLAGASEFLTKPLDLHFLADVCARVLRDSRHQRLLLERESEIRRLDELVGHVHAADYSLQRGQTARANQHLQHAVRACRSQPPSDDQWTRLLNAFQ